MSRIDLLIDSVFTHQPAFALLKPTVQKSDFETISIDICSVQCTHLHVGVPNDVSKLILPRKRQERIKNPSEKLRAQASLFLTKGGFQEILGNGFFMEAIYLGFYGKEWNEATNIENSAFSHFSHIPYPSKTGLYWSDDLSLAASEILASLSCLAPDGIWIQKFDWNNLKLWLPLLSILVPCFESVQLISPLQSDFPIPFAYIKATHIRSLINDLPAIIEDQIMVRQCVLDGYSKFLVEINRVMYRNDLRMAWLLEHPDDSFENERKLLETRPESTRPSSPTYEMTDYYV